MRKLVSVLALFLSALPSPVLSRATVFVPKEAGLAWEVRTLSFMPRDTSDEGISIAKINAWINDNRGMKSKSDLCFMNFVDNDDIVSQDRATESEIAEDLKKHPASFRQIYEPEPGKRFLVRVGVFRFCDDPQSAEEPLSFMAAVVSDDGGEVKNFDALAWNLIRLFKRPDGKLNVLGCFACGEVQELLWDKFNDRFYYNWIGH